MRTTEHDDKDSVDEDDEGAAGTHDDAAADGSSARQPLAPSSAPEPEPEPTPDMLDEDDAGWYDVDSVLTAANTAISGAPAGRPYYEWDPQAGVTTYVQPEGKRGGDKVAVVFRFRVGVLTILRSATQPDKESSWIVTTEISGRRPRDLSMPPEARESKYKAAAWLANVAPECVIELDQERHFLQALKVAAAEADVTTLPERMGWFDHPVLGWVHLASGRDYGIGQNGVERSIFLDKRLLGKTDLFNPTLMHFGALVRPCEGDEERAQAESTLRDIILCAPCDVSVPWLVANMLAPLRSVVLQTDMPTAMLTSRTGSRKTSYSNAVASMFGTFSSPSNKRGVTVASWSNRTSTASMTRLFHLCGDQPLVVQDYKKKTANKDTVALIQSVTDNSGTQRAQRTGALREGLGVNAMVLATGEQSFAEEESVASRVFDIAMEADSIDNSVLTRIQQAAHAGVTQRIGGDYLKWVASSGILSGDTLERDKEAAEKWLRPKLQGARIHDGVIQTGVVMLAGLRILRRFIHATYSPAFATEMDGHLQEGSDAILARTIERGRSATEKSEVYRFLDAFVTALFEARDEGYSWNYDPRTTSATKSTPEPEFIPGDGNHPTPSSRNRCIARHRYEDADDRFEDPIFLISDDLTFAWFTTTHRDTTLTWASLKSELIDPAVGGHYVQSARMVPLDRIIPEGRLPHRRGVEISLSAIKRAIEGVTP